MQTSASAPTRRMPRPLRPLMLRLRRVLALPLLYKVLLANSIVILLGATLGTFLATHLRQRAGMLMLVLFVLGGLLVSVGINYVLLKLALHPLTQLRETMRAVQRGDLARQAVLTGLDPDADQLADTFNTMLAALDDLTRTRASQILLAQEQERRRIARELHDETSQILTSLLLSLAVLEESIPTPTARERVAETRQLAHQTLRAVRNLSIDLRPSALDDLGLLPALRWYIKEYSAKSGLSVELATSGLRERLPPEVETAVYRIVQESLTNCARHARAQRAVITLTQIDDVVALQVQDDGCGFDVQAMLKRPWQDRGLGLAGMSERATLLDGTLEVQSELAQGTTVKALIPLHRVERVEASLRW